MSKGAAGVVPAFLLICACAPRASAQDGTGLSRPWTLFIVPYSHLDVGFTQSQAKVLAKQKNNLRIALDLIDQTNGWPEGSKFKYLIETSWPAIEFMKDPAVSQADKDRLVNALLAGRMEMGAFYINHQNRFLDGEALLRSVALTLDAFKRPYEIPVDTAVIDDVCDGSGVLNALTQHQVRYFILGCNASHWALPPLFTLEEPGVFHDRLMVYLPPFIGGYNGAFDLSLKADLPFNPAEAPIQYEMKIFEFLAAMEHRGIAPLAEQAFDYRGKTIHFPYDALLVPFPSPHGPDNGEQDLTASEIVRDWNTRHDNPRMIVATPREFFAHIERSFRSKVPVLNGELGGWWGEQIFWDLLQSDPRKESLSRDAFRMADAVGPYLAAADPSTSRDARDTLSNATSKILLNTDHNPAPVPFGNTPYTEEDVKEWQDTRRKWIEQSWDSLHSLTSRLASSPASEAYDRRLPEPRSMDGTQDRETCAASLNEEEAGIRREDAVVHLSLNPFGITRIENPITGEDLLESAEGSPLFQYGTLTRPEGGPLAGGPLNGLGARPTYRTSRFRPATRVSESTGDCGIESTFQAESGFTVRQAIRLVPGLSQLELTAEFISPPSQSTEHVLSFHLPPGSPASLVVDGPYRVVHYGVSDPMNWFSVPLQGQLFAALDLVRPMQTINATNDIFQWIRGIPRSLVFRNFAELNSGNHRLVYTSRDSGALIPFPYRDNPLVPESVSGFDHVCLGSTAWGALGLGAEPSDGAVCRAALQFKGPRESISPAHFAQEFTRKPAPDESPGGALVSTKSRYTVATLTPETEPGRPVVRLFQAGPSERVGMTLSPAFAARSAFRATASGEPRCRLPFNEAGGELRLDLAENELATLVFSRESWAELPTCPQRIEGSCECETVGAPALPGWGDVAAWLPLAAIWFLKRRRYLGGAGG